MSSTPRPAFVVGLVSVLAAGFGFYAGSTHSVARATTELTAAPNGRIAACDVLGLAKKMLEGDRYAPARKALVDEGNASADAMGKELTELRAKIEALGQSSKEAEPLIADFQTKARTYQDAKGKVEAEFSTLLSAQFDEAYRLIVETTTTIAKKQGFTYVMASRTGPVAFENKEFQAAAQEALSRPLLLVGDGDDLTAAVMAELKIQDKPAADANKPTEAKPDAPKAEPK